MTANKASAAITDLTVVITITLLSVTVSLQRAAVLTSFTTNYTTQNT